MLNKNNKQVDHCVLPVVRYQHCYNPMLCSSSPHLPTSTSGPPSVLLPLLLPVARRPPSRLQFPLYAKSVCASFLGPHAVYFMVYTASCCCVLENTTVNNTDSEQGANVFITNHLKNEYFFVVKHEDELLCRCAVWWSFPAVVDCRCLLDHPYYRLSLWAC